MDRPEAGAQETSFLQAMEEALEAERRGDLERAEELYRLALLQRQEEVVLRLLGRILEKRGNLDEAELVYEAAIQFNPDSLEARVGLAGILVKGARLQEAFQVLTEAAQAAQRLRESGTRRSNLFLLMGTIKLQLHHLQEALALFDQAGQASPGDPELQIKIGDSLVRAGHPAESEAYYQRALELNPELAHGYNHLGIAYRRQGKCDKALEVYRRAVELQPEDEHLLANMARCHFEMAEVAEALRIIDQALQINPRFTFGQRFQEALRARLRDPAIAKAIHVANPTKLD